jgi:tRNA-splicing ligase RtcB
MGNIKPKELSKLGYTDNVARSLAIELVAKHCKHHTQEEIIQLLQDIIVSPANYKQDGLWGRLAEVLSPTEAEVTTYELRKDSLPYIVYGSDHIDELAKSQMEMAMRLPVTLSGALMPDGCAGYGLPIGGVLATTDDVVIPYAVGKDIGCRMSLTILDAGADYLGKHHDRAVEALLKNTAFGLDGILPFKQYHSLFDKSEFREIPLLKKLREKAVRQLGTSGKGNHFVDICEIELSPDNALGLSEGNYLGILSHSGSRGLGAAIADYYTGIAKETCRLPRQAGPFAWLSLNNEAGQEYWKCMEIAGEYSAINHECIHRNVAKALRLKPLANVSNHHNFAWRDQLSDGRSAIIHRKGATPAHPGELGIIPGSMATPGYIVSGIGSPKSLFSASHGAGRTMSRLDARNSISRHALKRYLAEHNVTLIGGTTEEAPQAYKDIHQVMKSQQELVNIEGKIIPHIVRMSEE